MPRRESTKWVLEYQNRTGQFLVSQHFYATFHAYLVVFIYTYGNDVELLQTNVQ